MDCRPDMIPPRRYPVSHVKSREGPRRSVGCWTPAEQYILDGSGGCVQVGDVPLFELSPSSTAVSVSVSTVHRANDNHTGCSLSSAKRIGDPDAAVVLAVAEVFGQDLRAAHGAGCLDDRGVPV